MRSVFFVVIWWEHFHFCARSVVKLLVFIQNWSAVEVWRTYRTPGNMRYETKSLKNVLTEVKTLKCENDIHCLTALSRPWEKLSFFSIITFTGKCLFIACVLHHSIVLLFEVTLFLALIVIIKISSSSGIKLKCAFTNETKKIF